MSRVIWTETARRELYRQLGIHFGPYCSWSKPNTPGIEDDVFHRFCENFAACVGAKSGKAVWHQIKFTTFGIGHRDSIKGPQLRNYVLNMAAAFEMGFISNKELIGYKE